MSMSNFIGVGAVGPPVMVPERIDRRSSTSDRTAEDLESGVGLAHPTVVPTNFDPDAADGRRE